MPPRPAMPFLIDAPASEGLEPLMAILGAVMVELGALSRIRKEEILLAALAARGSAPNVASRRRALEELGVEASEIEAIAGGRHAACRTAAESALLDFGRKLSLESAAVGRSDIERLRERGYGDEEILEAVLATGCAALLCHLDAGLPAAGFEVATISPAPTAPAPTPAPPAERQGPYLRAVEMSPAELPAFATLQKNFGFVPKLYRAQTLAPRAVEAEVRALEEVLFAATSLGRPQKEAILLALSAANRNTYCVTLHGRALQMAGVPAESVERITDDPGRSDLTDAEKAMLEATRALAAGAGRADFDGLRRHGWSPEQIAEAVGVAALAAFLNTVQMGLGVPPDFRPRRDLLGEASSGLNLSGRPEHPTEDGRKPPARVEDPDGPLVARAREGDMSAFEELVRRHQGRIYRTLMGITGNAEDAQDGAQSVFLKVFRKLPDFGGEARFSTWLHRIAVNEGLERLRSRRPTESLDDGGEEDFRPSSLQPWIDDPESRFARAETRRIVEDALGRLPAPYRTALVLRDIQELSGAEAAAALGIPLPTLKTHLLRGRLMLREALAVYFTAAPRPARA